MGIKALFAKLPLANYGQAIKQAPREVIFNRSLILSSMLYASSAIPATWDQGSASVIPSLPGFQKHFNISSGSNASAIRNFVTIVYIGYAAGAAASFFINDKIGRLWSYRLYVAVWTVGQLVAALTPGMAGLYASRIITGLGIGSLTVTGPMSIVEIAPDEIRGLLTAWFLVAMGISAFTAIFCVYGVYLHLPEGRLQYQTVFFAPCIFMMLCVVASFFIYESPRWLLTVGRRDDAVKTLCQLRGLSSDHPRVQREIAAIENSIRISTIETDRNSSSFVSILRETFTVASNLRRLQQVLLSYAFAQLSGANSVTSYFVPIMTILGFGGGTSRTIFLSGMYNMSKLFFTLISSFLLIDTLGRRKSLFIGITFQAITHIYLGVFIKYNQEGKASDGASKGAIAALFIHAFGYAVGLYVLPYVFGGELWPNRIRSFGGALGQTFHWLFIYAMGFGTPSLLDKTNNWGAFIFFAAWCFVALIYVYLMVPEVSGMSVEDINRIFEGPWYNARRRARLVTLSGVSGDETIDDLDKAK